MTFFVRCRLFLRGSRSGVIFSSAFYQTEEWQKTMLEYIVPFLAFLKDHIEDILNFSLLLSFLFIFFNIHRGLTIYFAHDIDKDKKIQKWNFIFKSIFWFFFILIFSVILYYDYLNPSPFPFNVSGLDCKRSTKFILAYILGTLSLYINYNTFGTWSWRTLLAVFSLLTTTLFLCMFISEPFASTVRVEIVKWGMCLYLLFRLIQLLCMELVHWFNTGGFMTEGGIILKLKSQWNPNLMMMGGETPRKPENVLAMEGSFGSPIQKGGRTESKPAFSSPWKRRWGMRDARQILKLSSHIKYKPEDLKLSDREYLNEIAYSHFTKDSRFWDDIHAKAMKEFKEELAKYYKIVGKDSFKDWGYYYKSDNFYDMLSELRTDKSIESSSKKVIKELHKKKIEESDEVLARLKRLGVPVSVGGVHSRVGETPSWGKPGSGVSVLWGLERNLVRGNDKVYQPVERSVQPRPGKTLHERWDEITLNETPGYRSKTGKAGPIYNKDGKVIPFTTAGYDIFTPIVGQEWWPRYEGRSKINQFPNCIEATPVNRIVLDWAMYLVLEKLDCRLREELEREHEYLKKFTFLKHCPHDYKYRPKNVSQLLSTTQNMLRGYGILEKMIDTGLTRLRTNQKIHLQAMHDWRHNYIYRVTYGLDKSKYNIGSLIYNMFMKEHWKGLIKGKLSFEELLFYLHLSENVKQKRDIILDLTLPHKHDFDYEYDPGTELAWDRLITAAFHLLYQLDGRRISERDAVYSEYMKNWNAETVEMDTALHETGRVIKSNREDLVKKEQEALRWLQHWRLLAARERENVYKLGKLKDDSDLWVHEVLPRERRNREASLNPNLYSKLELQALRWLEGRPELLKSVKYHNDQLDYVGGQANDWKLKQAIAEKKLKDYEEQVDHYHPFYSLKKDIKDAFVRDFNRQMRLKGLNRDNLLGEIDRKYYGKLEERVKIPEKLRIIDKKNLEVLLFEDERLIAKALSIYDSLEDGIREQRALVKEEEENYEKQVSEINEKMREKLYIREKRQWKAVRYWENIGRIREARLKVRDFVQEGSNSEQLDKIAVHLRKISPKELHLLFDGLDSLNIETLVNEGPTKFRESVNKALREHIYPHCDSEEKRKYLVAVLKEMIHEKFVRQQDLLSTDYLSRKEKKEVISEVKFVSTYLRDRDMLNICQKKLDNIVNKLSSYNSKKKEKALALIQNIWNKNINPDFLLVQKEGIIQRSEAFEDRVNLLKALINSKGKNKMIEGISDVWNQLQEMTPENRKEVLMRMAESWGQNPQEKEELMKIVSEEKTPLTKEKIIDILELLHKNWEHLTPSTKNCVTHYLDKLESVKTKRGLQIFLNQVKSQWTDLSVEKREELLKVLDIVRTELRKEQLHSLVDKLKGGEVSKKKDNIVLLNNIKENVPNMSPEKLKDLKVLLDRWEKKNKLDLDKIGKIKDRLVKLSPERRKVLFQAYKDLKAQERLKIKKE
jgi:hypothetical protein